MKRYVVKRPFKSLGKFYGVGSIIEDPTAIKRFKSKVAEGKIIVVTEDNLQSVAAYIKARSGVNILPGFTKTETTDDRLPKGPQLKKSKPKEPKLKESQSKESKPVVKAKVVIKK